MKLNEVFRTIATLLAIIGSLIAFYVYTHDAALSVIFIGVVTSLSLHITTFDKLREISNKMATKDELEALGKELRNEIANIRSKMTTKEELEALGKELRNEIANIRSKMTTKEGLMALKEELSLKIGILADIVFNINNTLINFLAVRKVISRSDTEFLKSSLKTYEVMISRVLNPLKLSKDEKEAILRIIRLPLDDITEEDCDIAFEALRREMFRGSREAAKILSILVWIRAYIKYCRIKKKETS